MGESSFSCLTNSFKTFVLCIQSHSCYDEALVGPFLLLDHHLKGEGTTTVRNSQQFSARKHTNTTSQVEYSPYKGRVTQ